MNFPYGAVLLIFASIEAHKTPKVQIYEIRDLGNDGIELRDLAFNPKSQQKAESKLLDLFQIKKQTKKETNVAQQLDEKLKNLKGREGNKISDDAFIYILNNILEASDSSSKEAFVDKTRTEDPGQPQEIRDILENLLRHNLKKTKTDNQAPSNSRFRSFYKGIQIP